MTFHFQFLMSMQLEFFDGNIQIRSTKIHRDIDDKFPAPVQSVDLEQKKKTTKNFEPYVSNTNGKTVWKIFFSSITPFL